MTKRMLCVLYIMEAGNACPCHASSDYMDIEVVLVGYWPYGIGLGISLGKPALSHPVRELVWCCCAPRLVRGTVRGQWEVVWHAKPDDSGGVALCQSLWKRRSGIVTLEAGDHQR